MIPMRLDADHGSPAWPHWRDGVVESTHEVEFRGTEDWIYRAVGTDRDVLLIGAHALRFARGLADRRCRVVIADGMDDRRFDVVLAVELLDCPGGPAGLLDEFPRRLKPGGWVVATQSRPVIDGSARPRPDPGKSLLSLFEGSGFAVAQYRRVGLPHPDASAPGMLSAFPNGPGVDRSLVVALPVGDLCRDWRDPIDRNLVEERDAANRLASDLARDLRTTSARVESLADRLGRSLHREEELRGLLLLAHGQIERDDEELRSLARKFQDDLRRESEQREALEARLSRIRQSVPGRIFLALRAITSGIRR